MSRDKLDPYVTQEEREEFFAALVDSVVIVEPTTTIRACRDPKDDKFLELAIEGGARAIISGDDDLLTLHPFRGIQVLSPATFASGQAPSEGHQ